MPRKEGSQNDINLSTIVAAALMDGGTPAAENKSIIIPSTAPTPPGKMGSIPIRAAITKTVAMSSREIG